MVRTRSPIPSSAIAARERLRQPLGLGAEHQPEHGVGTRRVGELRERAHDRERILDVAHAADGEHDEAVVG